MPATRRPSAKDSAAPIAIGYAEWRARTAAELEQRYGVRWSTIPQREWTRLYVRGLSPQEAAAQADVIAYNMLPPAFRILGRKADARPA
jgi:hypothetical protein